MDLLLLCIDSLPNNKFLHWSKLKALADVKINVTEKLKLFWAGQKTLWEFWDHVVKS